MKRFYFIYLLCLVTTLASAQTESQFWVGVDGSYWQNSVKSGNDFGIEKEFYSSIRPMIGLKVSDKWDVGIMTSINSYEEAYNSFSYTVGNPIFDGDGNVIGTNTRTDIYDVSVDNNLFGVGLFARRHIPLGKKTSINLSPYAIRESGDSGSLNIFYPFGFFDPCVNCLSITPGPLQIPIEEENWRFGVDAAFAYQAGEWIKLEIRANLLELRRQNLSSAEDFASILPFPDPISSVAQSYLGSYTDFGSAIRRQGIRFGLVLSPF